MWALVMSRIRRSCRTSCHDATWAQCHGDIRNIRFKMADLRFETRTMLGSNSNALERHDDWGVLRMGHEAFFLHPASATG